MSYLADPSKPLTHVRHDEKLYNGAKFYRDRKRLIKCNPLLLKQRYPEYMQAYNIFYHSHYGGWRWYIEALLMAGCSNEEIRELLKINIPVEVLDIYRKVFFDVEPYLQSEAAVYANILSISRLNIKPKTDCDYTWKIFAYTWGAEPFLKCFANSSPSTNEPYARWFRDMAKANLTVSAFQYSADLKKSYNMETLEILRIAKDYWTISDGDMAKAEKMAEVDLVTSLTNHVDMCLLKASSTGRNVEERAGYEYAFFDVDK